MDISDRIALRTLARASPHVKRNLALLGCAAALLASAEAYNGGVTKALNSVKRGLKAAIAAWLEEQGGLKLFTIEGDEPEETQTHWDLPWSAIPRQLAGDSPSASGDQIPSSSPQGGRGAEQDGTSRSDADSAGPAGEPPNFFASTKFFACLDLKESQELYEAAELVKVEANQVLFQCGDDSESGIFIVVEGQVGVFLEEGEQLLHTNTLFPGESVGDLDVLDGATRSVTCITLDEGAVLVQISRALFMEFIVAKPRTLQIYLHKAIARLWRVAHFVLSDFLNLSLQQSMQSPVMLAMSPAPSLDALAGLAGSTRGSTRSGPTRSPPPAAAHESARSAPHQHSMSAPNLVFDEDLRSDLSLDGTASSHSIPKGHVVQAAGTQFQLPTNVVHKDKGARFQPRLAAVSEASLDISPQAAVAESPFSRAQPLAEAESDQAPASPGSDASTSTLESQPSGFAAPVAASLADTAASMAVTTAKSVETVIDVLEEQPVIDAMSAGAPVLPTFSSQAAAEPQQIAGYPIIREDAPASASFQAGNGAAELASSAGSSAALARTTPPEPLPMISPFAAINLNSTINRELMLEPPSPAQDEMGPDLPLLVKDGHLTTASAIAADVVPSVQSRQSMDKQSDASGTASQRRVSHIGLGDRIQTQSLPTALLLKTAASGKAAPSSPASRQGSVLATGLAAPPQAVGPVCLRTSAWLRNSLVYGPEACLATGWDVVSVEECQLGDETWRRLTAAPKTQGAAGHRIALRRGSMLQGKDQPCRQFYVVLEGHLVAERQKKSGKADSALIGPGSLIGCAAYLSSTRTSAAVRAAETCHLAAFGAHELEALLGASSESFVELLLTAACALGPIIRRFISLGLNRVWLNSGNLAYRQGEPAQCLYIIISGRLRLVREEPTSRPPVRVEEEVGRGEAVGAVWAITGGIHDTTALCVRDSELVRMSKGAFELIASQCPKATAGMLEGMARRLAAASSARSHPLQFDSGLRSAARVANTLTGAQSGKGGGTKASGGKGGEIVTIALVPAGMYKSLLAAQKAVSSAPPPSATVGDIPDSIASLAESLGAKVASPAIPEVASAESITGPKGDSGDLASSTTAARATSTTEKQPPGKATTPFGSMPAARAASMASGTSGFSAFSGTSATPGGISAALSMNQNAASVAVRKLGAALKAALEELFGPTLHLTSSTVELTFPTAFERLHVSFYRSKITSWMASQEEDYRFILLAADAEATPWSRICVSQADCILLVGGEGAGPQINPAEQQLIWSSLKPPGPPPAPSVMRSRPSVVDSEASVGSSEHGSESYRDAQSFSAQMRRVELVMLHAADEEPTGTLEWLKLRPHLARHHHIRLSYSKDMARLARWMAGKAVGLVLSGGGSRGLAHLGILHALDDAGIPVDVVGGTSQGAFMAGLYAQGLSWEAMHSAVRNYAAQMASVRHLLFDLTLPLISVFSGAGFDRVVRETFSKGAQRIEDLWLSFFCISTNLSKGEPSVHDVGELAKLVRASMTIVGLVPPVYEDGDLLVDGGYLNNIPVDVMRSMGVETVIVVDVEDKDDSVWHNLTAYDGGLSGWRLLWDRWCPIPSLRYGYKLPRYNQIVNALTWMSHAQNLRRVSRDYVIDLYLQPPVSRFRLMDYHLMERIVRDANRYAWGAISEWQVQQGVTQQGKVGADSALRLSEGNGLGSGLKRSHSISCMTQLQAKQASAAWQEEQVLQAPARGGRRASAAAESGGLARFVDTPDLMSTSEPPLATTSLPRSLSKAAKVPLPRSRLSDTGAASTPRRSTILDQTHRRGLSDDALVRASSLTSTVIREAEAGDVVPELIPEASLRPKHTRRQSLSDSFSRAPSLEVQKRPLGPIRLTTRRSALSGALAAGESGRLMSGQGDAPTIWKEGDSY
ncbi:hypothetical protein WJX72_007850 [[Myrmecia] bisecta]|uniref:Patatin n=1 Tax=[Myrmecia] bisecta TaxID=41462 RepID=A0AAW1Q336_9CHLO